MSHGIGLDGVLLRSGNDQRAAMRKIADFEAARAQRGAARHISVNNNTNDRIAQLGKTGAVRETSSAKSDKLTQQDLDKLKKFKEQGDRYGYWNYMATKFNDPYARIALSVVTNEDLAGFTANGFMKAEAFERGIKIDSKESWIIGTDLMNADYNARQKLIGKAPDGGLKLPVRTISEYHRDVFHRHGLGDNNAAWTAGFLVDPHLAKGDDASAEAVWKDVLDNGGIKQGAYEVGKWFLCGKWGCMSDREVKWSARIQAAGATYGLGLGQSARTINQIDGWQYDESARQWSKGWSTLAANDAKAIELNAEREFRIKHFGEHVIR